jgi:hypothetical protein
MGATTFIHIATGRTATEAFHTAKEEAYWECGHGGYTGTIAEKPGFLEFTTSIGTGADLVAALEESYDAPSEKLIEMMGRTEADYAYATYDSKWGPAVAVRTGPTEWTFCGWASC